MSVRRGSVYLAVVVVVSAVTALALTGVTLRRHLHERARLGADASAARRLAQSGSELLVEAVYRDNDAFRERAAAGTVYNGVTLAPGTVSISVTDADTGTAVTGATENFQVVSEAEAGRARSRLGFQLHTPDDDLTAAIKAIPEAVAYWPLDEVNQSQATERLADRHGTYQVLASAGGTTHDHGNPAPLIQWHTQFVRVPHHPVYELTNGTICLWARFDLKPTTSGIQMGVISKESNPYTGAMSLALYLERDHLVLSLNDAPNKGTSIRCSSSKITQGKWHFLTITFGDAGLELYVDGKREARDAGAEIDLNSMPGFFGRPANTSAWRFGVRNVSSPMPVFGSVARVSVFSSRLSESQIRTLRDATSLAPGIVVRPGSFARVVD
jgi:hypothetical protein